MKISRWWPLIEQEDLTFSKRMVLTLCVRFVRYFVLQPNLYCIKMLHLGQRKIVLFKTCDLLKEVQFV